jgi:hypothetical protein
MVHVHATKFGPEIIENLRRVDATAAQVYSGRAAAHS